MSKQQIIETICQYNRSAGVDFLSSFEERSLRDYLERLTRVRGNRGRNSVWVRPSDTPAIISRIL